MSAIDDRFARQCCEGCGTPRICVLVFGGCPDINPSLLEEPKPPAQPAIRDSGESTESQSHGKEKIR